MKVKKGNRGFTLAELMAVMVVIAVLTALILGAAGPLKAKAQRSQTQAEIAAISLALTQYQIDNGDYPVISDIPIVEDLYEGNPEDYYYSAEQLFSALVRGGEEDAYLDIPAGPNVTVYLELKRSQVGNPDPDSNPPPDSPSYLRDPYGKPYAYYYSKKRSEKSLFNIVEPDFWSTGGQEESPLDVEDDIFLNWITNWAE